MTTDVIASATERLHGRVIRTPLQQSRPLTQRLGPDVLLKLENLQHTGSFKARGAFNKLLTIDPASRSEGIIAASSGNHGAAVAWCARELGTVATIFVPEGASAAKIDKIRSYGAVVRFHGIDGLDTEIFAREEARLRGQAYVSPYNDEAVVAGQGTVGVELVEQDAHLDAVFIAVGGGGLIGGVGAWLRDRAPNIQVIGAVPANSPVMAASVRAGRVLAMESHPTLSEGTAGGIERDSMTFALCQEVVDEWAVVPEDEIGRVLREFVIDHDMPIEGAAAVAVAAAIALAPAADWRRIGIVICGGNIAAGTLATVMNTEQRREPG